MSRSLLLASVVVCSALVPERARAMVMQDLSETDVASRADAIVLGEVTDVATVRVSGRPMTEVTLAPSRVLRGSVSPVFVLTQYGGKTETGRIEIPGAPVFRVGERVAVMTRRAPDGRNYLVAMALSVYRERGERLEMILRGDILGADHAIRPGPHRRMLTLDALVELERRTRTR